MLPKQLALLWCVQLPSFAVSDSTIWPLLQICTTIRYRDEPQQGRVVKRLDFDCTSGNIDWHGPYGGLYIEVHGPAERHQLCLQTRSVHTSAFFYSVPDADSPTTKLLTLNETKGNEKAPTSTLCFEAQGSTVFLVVPDLGAPISSVIHISYDIDSPPSPGDDGESERFVRSFVSLSHIL